MGDLKGVEALRGLAAIGIAIYSWLWAVGMTATPPAANLHLLYDLYFVISGFVLAQIYRVRLTKGGEAARFALLRFGRVYPLHLAMLLVFLALQTGGFPAGSDGSEGSLGGFIVNLAMLQGVGVVEPVAWNIPAWFISVEFALSILFALLCLADIPRSPLGLGALMLCVFWALWMLFDWPEGRGLIGSNMLLRGFAGFMLGVLAQALWRSQYCARAMNDLDVVRSSLLGFAAIGASVALILYAPPTIHALSPLLFAGVVFVISATRGAVGWLLLLGPLQSLARISFGVLMCHWLLAGPVREAAMDGVAAALSDLDATPTELAVMAAPIYLLAVIGLAIMTECWVERPTRDAMRAWIERRSRGYVASRRQSDVV